MIAGVDSHHKILEKFGEGGMGVVFKAEDLTLTRTVAFTSITHAQKSHEPEWVPFLQAARSQPSSRSLTFVP